MKYPVYIPWGVLLFTLIIPSVCLADTWTCHYEELTRNVVVLYPNEPARPPCKVYYAKPNENVIPRTLWEAQHEVDYCQRKAAGFIKRLESWGWQCNLDNDGQTLQ